MFTGDSESTVKVLSHRRHNHHRLSTRFSRQTKVERTMKQEPDDDESCYLDEGMISSVPGQPTRVRSHARSLRAMANPSAVWAHFDLCTNDPLRAQCRICGSVVVRGGANPRQCGTTNLHRHLRVHHGGRLIGRRYHVMHSNSQGTSSGRTIRIAPQPAMRQQAKNLNSNNQPKTLVLKTIPLKMKSVAPTTIKIPSSKQPNIRLPPNIAPQQPTEVCLRWNSYHSNMQNSFPSLLDSEQFVDVTLACEGRSLKCHKMILSSCSDYLAALLRENPCQHPIILMKDLKFWEVEALVKFMYRGEVNVAHDKLPQLLNAAEALQVKGLAGPTPSSQNPKPPMLIPQPKANSQTTSTSSARVTSESKEMKNSNLPTTSPKRVPKRSISESFGSKTFTKIRLQRPTTPTSPNPTIKLEPLDIPLSPTDIFPDNEDNSTNNYENLMSMHEDDDPGGVDHHDSIDDDIHYSTLTGPSDPNDSEDHMEFVPTDFLEQEQEIVEDVDGDCSRSSGEKQIKKRKIILDKNIEDNKKNVKKEENLFKKEKT
ncbi:uncharacterized protein [Chelonus insularis]|nr:uncharacterized protein LOC118069029 isoform X2 [Chelonus insularis]XP_034942754.1 uncharacterized protein LOC118069029 isoform X2 [Chelonus insularis]XP_034942763.1 uncharacterized protein LOC118069029 isoform X2 [Chelonus insularis]